MSFLAELETTGYSFRLDGDQLMVSGPRLDDPATVERLRSHKPDILREIRVREFVRLVRVTAACEHGRLLHQDAIRRELGAADIDALQSTTREERQAWAAAIAQRLAAPDPSWQLALDALRKVET